MANITQILLRRDSKANWDSLNPSPVLGAGEPAIALENNKVVEFKIGDGNRTWVQLPNIISDVTEIDDIKILVEALNTQINGDPEDLTDGLAGQVDTLSNVMNDEETGIAAINNTLNALSENKQDKLTAGTNITIENNTISTIIPEAPTAEGIYLLKCIVGEQKEYFWEAQVDSITFKVGINSDNYTIYEAKDTMTWAQFVASSYNREYAFRLGDTDADQDPTHIYNSYGNEVEYDGNAILATDTIVADRLYLIVGL